MKEENSYIRTYIFAKNDDTDKYPTRIWLVKLFSDFPAQRYRSHEEIVNALDQHYGVKRSQSAISKHLSPMLGEAFKVKDRLYIVTKFQETYLVQDEASFSKNLRTQMIEDGMFEKQQVYYQEGPYPPQTFIFWICNNDNAKEKAMDNIKNMLQYQYLDIFYFENRLIILLNPKSSKFSLYSDVLKHFFAPYYDAYKRIK